MKKTFLMDAIAAATVAPRPGLESFRALS